MSINLRKYARDIRAALNAQRFSTPKDGGIGLFNDGLRLTAQVGGRVESPLERFKRFLPQGEFRENSMGVWTPYANLVVDQGAIRLFNVMFGSLSKITAWYIAPFDGSASPTNAWTAANFTSNSTENTSGTEGYSEATRQAVAFTDATVLDEIDNYSSEATLTIACTGTHTFTGAGLLSVATKGGTSGVLYSATKFGSAVILNDTATWKLGYRAVGTPS